MPIEKQVSHKKEKEPEVTIRGWLKDTFKESHKLTGNTVILENTIRTIDGWGKVKPEITLQVDGRFLKKSNRDFAEGDFVEVQGELRTKNIYDNEGNKIQRRCYVFIKSIKRIDELSGPPMNYVCVRGALARKGKIYHCENDNSMFDFTLDIRRSRGRRSSVPCVIWGKTRSQRFANVEKGADVEVDGWLKSRTITDSLGITKTVVEIIVDSFIVHD